MNDDTRFFGHENGGCGESDQVMTGSPLTSAVIDRSREEASSPAPLTTQPPNNDCIRPDLRPPTDYTLSIDKISVTHIADAYLVEEAIKRIWDIAYHGQFLGFRPRAGRDYRCDVEVPLGRDRTILIQAGLRKGSTTGFRIEFNPTLLNVAEKARMRQLVLEITTIDSADFFYTGIVTRCDLAIDLFGWSANTVIVQSPRKQYHEVGTGRDGRVVTMRHGTSRCNQHVIYTKNSQLQEWLRYEVRSRPRVLGSRLVNLKNPFDKVNIVPAKLVADLQIPNLNPDHAVSYIRLHGYRAFLKSLSSPDRRQFRAMMCAESILPSADSVWACWPSLVAQIGLVP